MESSMCLETLLKISYQTMQTTTLASLKEAHPKARVSKHQRALVDLHIRANKEAFLWIKGSRVKILDSRELIRVAE